MKKNHWLIVISIFMMMLMGTVYAYSVFRVHIETLYGVGTLQSGLPYMTSLLFYAFSMMVSGRVLKPSRLRTFVFFGTLLIALGWLLSGIVTSLLLLVITYGILIGTGVGMVYGVPIYMVQKLYPKKSGMMTGLVLLGFGMSPLVTAPLASILINEIGLQSAFLVFGVIFIVIQLPLSFIYTMVDDQQMITAEPYVFKYDKPFLSIYALFVIATTIGLMMIGLSYQVGVVYYDFNALEVTASLSFFAIMNGVARPIFGRLMDKKGFGFSVHLSLFLMALASIIGLINQGNHLILYVISFAIYWFNLGAWLAIVPASVKAFYGIKQYARIYGTIFTAYGIGAVVGTIISGTIMDILRWTTYLYIFVLILILVSLGIAYQMNRSQRNQPLLQPKIEINA
ncbi:MAG: MFS transporter [Candidatus Izemoplasmataceae bacterium]